MPLVFVPTPLGNLRDVTLRALDALRDAEMIVAEDTRVARKLLRRSWTWKVARSGAIAKRTHGVRRRQSSSGLAPRSSRSRPMRACPEYPIREAIWSRQRATPAFLSKCCPGPSAAMGVALLSGFPLRRFAFEGFPPRTSAARREQFARALQADATTIWYESPQRIRAALADLAAVAPGAALFVVREYTKLHEQHLRGNAGARDRGTSRSGTGRGCLCDRTVRGRRGAPPTIEATSAAIDALLAEGHRVGEVAKLLAARGFGDRQRALRARGGAEGAPENLD